MSILRRTRVLFKHIILVSFIIPAANTRVVLMMRYAELWGHLRSNQKKCWNIMLIMLEHARFSPGISRSLSAIKFGNSPVTLRTLWTIYCLTNMLKIHQKMEK